MNKKIIALLLGVLVLIVSIGGCSSENKKDKEKLSIVTTIFPQYDFLREITKGVDNVEVKMLLKPGQESNDYDPAEVQQYQDFKKKLKSTRIKLSDQQKKEVAYYYDSYENFRRKMFGTLTLAEDGAYLDSVWSEIVDYSDGYLEYDANYAEQPIVLVNALDMMKPQLRNNFGADNHGVAMDLSLQIYEEYFKAQADSKVKALQRKMVHERALWHDKVRKEYYQKLAEERQRMKDKTGTIQSRVAV